MGFASLNPSYGYYYGYYYYYYGYYYGYYGYGYCANKKYGARFPCPVPRYRSVTLLLYQEDVRKRGEAILGAGSQPRLPQQARAGPEPMKPRPSRV